VDKYTVVKGRKLSETLSLFNDSATFIYYLARSVIVILGNVLYYCNSF